MGMYDEISVRCPRCCHYNIVQSKADKCTLATYSLENAPDTILEDISNEDIYCEECSMKFQIKLETVIKQVAHVAIVEA